MNKRNKMNCPICDYDKIEQVYPKLAQSVTSDSKLVKCEVSNVICKNCGNIFNQKGSRNQVLEFYKNDYKLMDSSSNAEFKYFTDDKSFSYSIWRLNLLSNNHTFSKIGKILDIGCGKGNFLREFSKKFPLWKLTGVEVSENALEFAKKRLSKAKLIEGLFDPKKINQKFDLIVSLGVLEHVENPVEFLKSISECLNENGVIFFDVPNFKLNPADLFVFDHLSHFTKETILNLLRQSGLEPVQIIEFQDQLPLSIICKKTKNNTPIVNNYFFMKNLVDEHLIFINNIFDSYEKTYQKYEKIGIFGLGIIFWAGIQNLKISKNKILHFFDENELLINKEKNGIQIKSLNDLKNFPEIPIIFSLNPCYIDRVMKKLKFFNCTLIIPSNFEYYKRFFKT